MLYRKAAEANDARAMVSLGLLLETGDHAPKDLKAAYALYEKAAERGSADGALDLAVALIKGKGIDVDIPRALALLEKASDGGSARAAYDLAALVSSGVRRQAAGRSARPLPARRGGGLSGRPTAPRPYCSTKGRGVAKNPSAAAEDLLRAVATDAGEARAELTGKNADLDSRDRPAASGAAQVGAVLCRPDRRKDRRGDWPSLDPMASSGWRASEPVGPPPGRDGRSSEHLMGERGETRAIG